MLRWLLSPLRALGVRTEAFMLSLSVAFRFVPVLVNDFSQLKQAQQARCASFEGSVSQRVANYARLFAPLARSSLRRADTLAEAFIARAFSCTSAPTSLHVARFGAREVVCLLVTATLAVLAIIL